MKTTLAGIARGSDSSRRRSSSPQATRGQRHDPILRAMVDELEHSRGLRVTDLDKPYFIEYSIEDADIFTASASLGGLLSATRTRSRIPQVNVRVGSYDFDNTNHVYSNYSAGARYDSGPVAAR